jgi:transposase
MGMRRLDDDILDWLCEQIPDAEVSAKGGRPAADKRKVIQGIFWVLDNGAKWKDLPPEFGAKSTVHRWFRKWAQAGVFEILMGEAGSLVEQRNGFKVYECFVDGTFAKAKGGGDGIGCTRAGKGVKIMIMVDAKGLPVAAYSTTASAHESHLVQRLFDFMVPGQVPERLIGDKAYDDDNLDDQMAEMGVEMIAPNRSNRSQTQDGRPLRRYKKRWTVERTIAWLQHFRRLCIRWEKSTMLFQGMLHLACCLLLMKEVLG